MPSIELIKRIRQVLQEEGTLALAKKIADAIEELPQECPSCGVWKDLDKPQESKWCECNHNFTPGATINVKDVQKMICAKCELPIKIPNPQPTECGCNLNLVTKLNNKNCPCCGKPIKPTQPAKPELPPKSYKTPTLPFLQNTLNDLIGVCQYLTERVR